MPRRPVGARHFVALVTDAGVISTGSAGFQPAYGGRHGGRCHQQARLRRPAGWTVSGPTPALPVKT